MMLGQMNIQVQKNKGDLFPYFIHKNELKIDHRSKHKQKIYTAVTRK